MNFRESQLLQASPQPLSEEAIRALREEGHSEEAITFVLNRLSEKTNVASPLRLARKILAEDFVASHHGHVRLGCEDCDAGYRPIQAEYERGNFVTEYCPNCRPNGVVA